jgi:hypothetical protein
MFFLRTKVVFCCAPSGLALFCRPTHGLRRGLYSCAASRLVKHAGQLALERLPAIRHDPSVFSLLTFTCNV